MYFTDFPGANHEFEKPQGMRDDQCGTLRVKRGLADVGGEMLPVSVSAWKPDADDLERLNNGGFIYLNNNGKGN